MSTGLLGVGTQPATPQVPSLARRATLTAIAALLDYGAKIAVGLVVTPILVSSLGRSLYGLWEMLHRLVGYASVVDGRPTAALRLVVAHRQGVDDADAQRRNVGAALVVWLLCLPLVAAVGGTLAVLSPAIARVPADLAGTVRLTAALLLGGLLMATLAAIPESVLRGMNLGYRQMGVQAALNVAGGLLSAGAVAAGLSLAGLAGAQIALAALTGVCYWVLARAYVAWFGIARPGRADVKALAGMSVWLIAGELIAKLILGSDVLILGMLVSPAAVTTYVLTAYAVRAALGIHAFTVGAAMPGLGGLVGQRQYGRAADAYGEIVTLTWLLAMVVGGAVLLWNRAFVTLWVGPEHYAGPWVNLLLALSATQTALIRTDAYIIDAALQPRPRVLVGAATAVITLGVAAALTSAFGMIGLCLGMFAGRLTQSIAYPLLVQRCLDGAAAPAAVLTRPLLVTATLFGACAWAGQRTAPGGWLMWSAGVVASVAVLACAALFLGFPPEARSRFLARIRRSMPRRAK